MTEKNRSIKAFFFFWRPSFLLLFATVIIYLLQLFPYTGVYLMMFGAIMWSAYTINAALLSMTIEALAGLIPRWFLFFPLLYFGGYTALTGVSHYKYYALKKEIEAHNTQVKTPFSASNHDLILQSKLGPAIFLTTYGLQAVYETNQNFVPQKHLVSVIGDQQACKKARGISHTFGFYTHYIRSHSPKDQEGKRLFLGKKVPDICLIKYPQDPQKPQYKIAVSEEKVDSLLLPLKKKTLKITSSDGTEYLLKGGGAYPYKWYPVPIIGCSLISMPASWKCIYGFRREKFTPLSKISEDFPGDSGAVAKALNLKPVPEEDKYVPSRILTDISKIGREVARRKKENEYERFEAFLSDPNSYSESYKFDTILSDKKYLASKATELINALNLLKRKHPESNFEEIKTLSKKRRILSSILAKFPIGTLNKHSSSLLGLFSGGYNGQWVGHNMELYIRLADLGEKSHSLLLKNMEEFSAIKTIRHTTKYLPLVYAICRAGPEIAPLVGETLLEKLKMVKKYYQYYRHKRALYIALARLGLKEKADEILTINEIGPLRAGDELISENSPPSVCVDAKGRPAYSDN